MTVEELKKECVAKKIYSYGTAQIFKKRQQDYAKKIKRITLLGLFSPVFIGASVASFSAENDVVKFLVIPFCGLVTIFQALLSLRSIVYKWDDEYSYSMTSVAVNTRLTNEYESLAKKSEIEIIARLPVLNSEYQIQEAADNQRNITDSEVRYGMRSALFQYKCKCGTCNNVPRDLNPTNCDTCGNFFK
ncbi:MAG TPA: hypothetical protein DG048_14030 [Pseudoalteromonas sp.]|nr:hypothetical protein [Pseudoalteromonas sp.]|tara:strand:+ start:1205 stop:1771 length:567 start_codon:yes stop_codon:yes gene_type:complete